MSNIKFTHIKDVDATFFKSITNIDLAVVLTHFEALHPGSLADNTLLILNASSEVGQSAETINVIFPSGEVVSITGQGLATSFLALMKKAGFILTPESENTHYPNDIAIQENGVVNQDVLEIYMECLTHHFFETVLDSLDESDRDALEEAHKEDDSFLGALVAASTAAVAAESVEVSSPSTVSPATITGSGDTTSLGSESPLSSFSGSGLAQDAIIEGGLSGEGSNATSDGSVQPSYSNTTSSTSSHLSMGLLTRHLHRHGGGPNEDPGAGASSLSPSASSGS